MESGGGIDVVAEIGRQILNSLWRLHGIDQLGGGRSLDLLCFLQHFDANFLLVPRFSDAGSESCD
ncbi:hypothetical protein LP419_08365 [Massilia sp. H-1]|nr:hypothetical protein LP419_08365 [Massilia sp. H-1]